MKATISISLLFICLCTGNITFAQNNILAGKLVDERNMPIPGSSVTVFKSGRVVEAIPDGEGVFYTPSIPAGEYHVVITIGGKRLSATNVFLPPPQRTNRYFNFKRNGNGVVVTLGEQAPSLSELEGKTANQPRVRSTHEMASRSVVPLRK